jgi:hypothetical protein
MSNVNRIKIMSLVTALLVLQSTFVLGFSSIGRIPFLSRRCSGGLVLQSTPKTIQRDSPPEADIKGTGNANALATKLLATCAEYGQVGSKLTEDQRSIIDDMASSLAPYTDPAPAQIDLGGTHDLIYSAAPGGSSGAVGPLVGKVQQSFLDAESFINRVELFGGILKVELNAERKVLDESRIRVKFKETVISLFGNEVKRGEAKGAGVWTYLFSGSVNVEGEEMTLRIMKTPSTFVIVQKQ